MKRKLNKTITAGVLFGIVVMVVGYETNDLRRTTSGKTPAVGATVPDEVQSFIDEMDAATNAGKWKEAAECCCLPFYASGNVIESRAKLRMLFEELNAEVRTKTLRAEVIELKSITARLEKDAQEFMAKGDVLVKVELELRQDGVVETDSGLYIFRKVGDKIALAGTLAIPPR